MTDRTDVLLVALAKSPKKSLSPVQVQKTLFLVAMEAGKLTPQPFYKFDKYNYGPFNAEIYADLNAFATAGLLTIDTPEGSRSRVYSLTSKGDEAARAKVAALRAPLPEYLQAVTQWATSLDFASLVRAIYKKYPAYKENSIFSD